MFEVPSCASCCWLFGILATHIRHAMCWRGPLALSLSLTPPLSLSPCSSLDRSLPPLSPSRPLLWPPPITYPFHARLQRWHRMCAIPHSLKHSIHGEGDVFQSNKTYQVKTGTKSRRNVFLPTILHSFVRNRRVCIFFFSNGEKCTP